MISNPGRSQSINVFVLRKLEIPSFKTSGFIAEHSKVKGSAEKILLIKAHHGAAEIPLR